MKKKLEVQLEIINSNNHEKIMALVEKKLCHQAEIALIKRDNLTEIKKYFANWFPHKRAQAFLVENGNPKTIRAYISCGNMFAQRNTEARFIETGCPEDVSLYISKGNLLYNAAEVALVKRGNSSDIKKYLMKRRICKDAEVALIKRGKHKEIMFYISLYKFHSLSQVLLFTRGNQKELKTYINMHGFSDNVLNVIVG